VVCALAALVPPRSSVLPPGAGNQLKKALKAEDERAENALEGEIDQAFVADRHRNASAIRRDHDGDVAAILPVEQAQADSPCAGSRDALRAAVSGQSSSQARFVNAPDLPGIVYRDAEPRRRPRVMNRDAEPSFRRLSARQ
jgi:hypothetical protein